MAKVKHSANLYAFLESKGVLATGDDREIEAAKRLYWANYKREWKKEKRKQNRAFTIYFDPKDAASIRKASTIQRMSMTKFIAWAALSAAGKGSSCNPAMAGQVRQAIVLCCVYIEGVLAGDIRVANKPTAIIARLEQLENEVLALIVQSNSSR
jgi:hypothetical protein